MIHHNQSRNILNLILEEPYRLFFPAAILAGFIGVALWPAHVLGWIPYPALAHSWLMTLGFLGGFILGFFWTALPRLLDVKHLSFAEAVICFGLWMATVIHMLMSQQTVALILMLTLLIVTFMGVAMRWSKRRDTPPPGFVLVVFGFLSLGMGLLIELPASWGTSYLFPGSRSLAWNLVHTAFPLLLFLGVAPYFFPKIMETQNRHEFETSRTLPKGWLNIALTGGVTAVVILTGMMLKEQGQLLGAWLIAFAVVAWGVAQIPLAPNKSARGSISHAAMFGLLMLYASVFGMAAFPEWRIAWFHSIMTGGITLCLILVSIRVVFGHSGDRKHCLGKRHWVQAIVILTIAASMLRLLVDFLPAMRNILLSAAAFLFLATITIWSMSIASRLFKPEAE